MGKIYRLQEEEKERKRRIQEAKKKLQSGRKQAWQAELLRKGKIELLGGIREKKLEARKKEWVERKNKAGINRASFVSRLDSLLQAASTQMEEEAWVPSMVREDEEKTIDLEIHEASPLRSPLASKNRKRASTPVTPKDFFTAPEFENSYGPAHSSEETIRKSNVTPGKGEGGEFTFDDIVDPSAEIDNEVLDQDRNRDKDDDEDEDEEEGKDNIDEHSMGHLFSPLDPEMKRGYSFSYTPTRVPDDDELERMSPLQRTYTTMKLSKGEDAGVLRMKELIANATG